jgi:hypothetical protein
MLSLFYQLPNYNLFTQHVLFILWRDTTSELWTLVLFPSYCYHLFILLALFTLLAYFHCFPLDTLIPFVSSKPVRLTSSSQVGNKVLGCVCAGSTLLLAEDESTRIVNGALVGVLLSQSASPSVVLSALLLNDKTLVSY